MHIPYTWVRFNLAPDEFYFSVNLLKGNEMHCTLNLSRQWLYFTETMLWGILRLSIWIWTHVLCVFLESFTLATFQAKHRRLQRFSQSSLLEYKLTKIWKVMYKSERRNCNRCIWFYFARTLLKLICAKCRFTKVDMQFTAIWSWKSLIACKSSKCVYTRLYFENLHNKHTSLKQR